MFIRRDLEGFDSIRGSYGPFYYRIKCEKAITTVYKTLELVISNAF